jgi:hypothetical protein
MCTCHIVLPASANVDGMLFICVACHLRSFKGTQGYYVSFPFHLQCSKIKYGDRDSTMALLKTSNNHPLLGLSLSINLLNFRVVIRPLRGLKFYAIPSSSSVLCFPLLIPLETLPRSFQKLCEAMLARAFDLRKFYLILEKWSLWKGISGRWINLCVESLSESASYLLAPTADVSLQTGHVSAELSCLSPITLMMTRVTFTSAQISR